MCILTTCRGIVVRKLRRPDLAAVTMQKTPKLEAIPLRQAFRARAQGRFRQTLVCSRQRGAVIPPKGCGPICCSRCKIHKIRFCMTHDRLSFVMALAVRRFWRRLQTLLYLEMNKDEAPGTSKFNSAPVLAGSSTHLQTSVISAENSIHISSVEHEQRHQGFFFNSANAARPYYLHNHSMFKLPQNLQKLIQISTAFLNVYKCVLYIYIYAHILCLLYIIYIYIHMYMCVWFRIHELAIAFHLHWEWDDRHSG